MGGKSFWPGPSWWSAWRPGLQRAPFDPKGREVEPFGGKRQVNAGIADGLRASARGAAGGRAANGSPAKGGGGLRGRELGWWRVWAWRSRAGSAEFRRTPSPLRLLANAFDDALKTAIGDAPTRAGRCARRVRRVAPHPPFDRRSVPVNRVPRRPARDSGRVRARSPRSSTPMPRR
jgi:hypothetical protein